MWHPDARTDWMWHPDAWPDWIWHPVIIRPADGLPTHLAHGTMSSVRTLGVASWRNFFFPDALSVGDAESSGETESLEEADSLEEAASEGEHEVTAAFKPLPHRRICLGEEIHESHYKR